MQGFFLSRLASRVVQLFGRINRGRSDYGAYLIAGRDLNTWLSRDRFVAMLPQLLQAQILLGRQVQDQMVIDSASKLVDLLEQVVFSDPRNAEWTSFYGQYIQSQQLDDRDVERVRDSQIPLENAALAEAQFAKFIWEGDIGRARLAFDDTIEATSRVDEKLAGWQALWLAWCFELEGDFGSASINYERARVRLGLAIPRYPLNQLENSQMSESAHPFIFRTMLKLSIDSSNTFAREMRQLTDSLRGLEQGSPRQCEEAVRVLGELLGFSASRPDNDCGTGPDVLWIDDDLNQAIAFELKTDKGGDSEFTKKDVGQAFDHLQFFRDNYGSCELLGLVFVSDTNLTSSRSNPSEEMFSCDLESLRAIGEEFVSILNDTRRAVPLERRSIIEQIHESKRFGIEQISHRIFKSLQ